MKYEKWIQKINQIVYEKINYTLDDLPDNLYAINYGKGLSPDEMAKIVISDFNKSMDNFNELFMDEINEFNKNKDVNLLYNQVFGLKKIEK